MNNPARDNPEMEITEIPHVGEVEEGQPLRSVAFPPETNEVSEEKTGAHAHLHQPRVEMRREMTKEDKELAAAGYEHLEQEKEKHTGKDTSFENVDIHEHKLAFAALKEALDSEFDAKNPTESAGLTSEEAKSRLTRDGRNVLTPPKKKSAFRKVSNI